MGFGWLPIYEMEKTCLKPPTSEAVCDTPTATTWSGAHRWPYSFVHFHRSTDINIWMVMCQILHAGHSKCMYDFRCPWFYLGVPYFDPEKNYFIWDTFTCIHYSAWLLFSSTACLASCPYCAKSRDSWSRTSLGFFPKPAWFLHAHWNRCVEL